MHTNGEDIDPSNSPPLATRGRKRTANASTTTYDDVGVGGREGATRKRKADSYNRQALEDQLVDPTVPLPTMTRAQKTDITSNNAKATGNREFNSALT